MPARNPVPTTPPVEAPIAPLGTAARIAKIRQARPDMTMEQAQITALTMELVVMHGHISKLDATVHALTAQVEALIGHVTSVKPIFQPTKQAAPVARVETPAATQRRMNPVRPAKPAKLGDLSFAGDKRLLAHFAAFVRKYGTGRGAVFTDDMFLKASEARDYLFAAANQYLDDYEGGDKFLLSVCNRDEEERSAKQLRGVLNNMLADYKATLTAE